MIQSNQEIISLCKRYRINNYSINLDGSIDVDGSVYLYNTLLTELPLHFNKVSGYFWCSSNKLTSLEGCPVYVGDSFRCNSNQLTSLDRSPEYVGGHFWCHDNPLEYTKENMEIISRYKYYIDFIKKHDITIYNMVIVYKRLNTINKILQ